MEEGFRPSLRDAIPSSANTASRSRTQDLHIRAPSNGHIIKGGRIPAIACTARYRKVNVLDAEVAGSGDVDASELVAKSAKLIAAGSGDTAIRGNPPLRDHSVAGSGDIKFNKN